MFYDLLCSSMCSNILKCKLRRLIEFADLFGGYDFLGICLRNCAQCKKMFGNFFEGQLCADSCVKFKGKVIPDCEDLGNS